MTDETTGSLSHLVQACRLGEEQAWHDLLTRISPLVFAICREHRLSQEESLDIFGQVCYLMVRGITRIRSADRLFAFVGTITRRQICNRFTQDRGLEFVDDERLLDTPDSSAAAPDQEYDAARQRHLLLEVLATLPQRDYQLLHALFFEDDEPTYEQIAARLHMPVASIGPTRARALKKLERLLLRRGYKFDVF